MAAKAAASHGRLDEADRAKLDAAHLLVEGVSVWLSTAGAACEGKGASHRKAKAQRKAARQALEDEAFERDIDEALSGGREAPAQPSTSSDGECSDWQQWRRDRHAETDNRR